MVAEMRDKCSHYPADGDQLFAFIEEEARKSFLLAAWPVDMIQHQVANISVQICDAEWRFSTQGGVETLFNQASSTLTRQFILTLQAHDWTDSHEHIFSSSARFFTAAAELLRKSVFEKDLESSVNAMMPCDPHLDKLALVAPRLCILFKQTRLRINFEAFDVSDVIAPLFHKEYDRLIGKLYNGRIIRSSLTGAAQLAARLRVALIYYPNVRFRYDGLVRDMVMDIHTLEAPVGKAWIVILPAIIVTDDLGTEMVLHKALAFNDSENCSRCTTSPHPLFESSYSGKSSPSGSQIQSQVPDH